MGRFKHLIMSHIRSACRYLKRLSRQVLRYSPFEGDVQPGRISAFQPFSKRPTLPFPHPWNYHEPIRILESYFWEAENAPVGSRHHRYLEIPGFSPVLVIRDPAMIRAITTDTGDKIGQFDRDTLPSTGIARATGKDTLLYSNGAVWKHQRKLAASPFGKTTLFQPEMFKEFEETFRITIGSRIEALQDYLKSVGQTEYQVELEPEIKAVMLELLVNNFFGADVPYEQLRNHYVPVVNRVIDHIVRDTVMNAVGIPIVKWPSFTKKIAQTKADFASFEELTDIVLKTRSSGLGLWKQFKADSPDHLLRSNLKVFLAGALEATTSYTTWALAHLARHPEMQEKVFQEVREVEDYSPDTLEQSSYFGHVLEETLRLTPSLYFLPRRAAVDTWVEAADGRKLWLPAGTHVLLDVWHANRNEEYWGIESTGFPATEFHPERWAHLAAMKRSSKDVLHFGFGHGPRVCPGKHLAQLEVALVVGAFVKVFKFRAVNPDPGVRAGVSTKPADGTLVNLSLRTEKTNSANGWPPQPQ